MVIIKVSTRIGVDPDRVFDVVRNIHEHTSNIGGVKSIEKIERSPNSFATKWEIDFDGAPFSWVQEEIVYKSTRTMLFKSVEGDFFIYCGEWIVEPQKDGSSLLKLEAYFNWGAPNMEKHVGKILERKANKALKGLVLAIKKAVMKANG
ncbi:MAG: SRPBCC family protein [Candidatus Omnitrophota bacterium]